MLILTIAKVALRSLLANKLRSFLAMLGIIIGVGAVISMLALGTGVQKQSLDRITAMGSNLLVIRPASRGSGGVNSGTQQNMTLADALAIVKLEDVKEVAPVVGGNAQLKYLNKNTRTSLIGTTPSYFTSRAFDIDTGRGFTEAEAAGSAHVIVIGPVTATNLFGTAPAVGETVKLNGLNFTVVGVLKSKGDQGYFNPDDQVLLPYTTAMKQLFGVAYLREIDIQAVDGADLNEVQDRVTDLLRARHHLEDDAPEDFTVRNQADLIETRNETNRTFTLLLGGIASISLLVGGIGIMNIMLVTVTERTREIGVRKSLGAKHRDILGQFLIEAVLMSGVGGILGVLAGFGGAKIVEKAMGIPTIVEMTSVVLSLGFSAGVGIFFGFYPARRAANMDPIEALRYE